MTVSQKKGAQALPVPIFVLWFCDRFCFLFCPFGFSLQFRNRCSIIPGLRMSHFRTFHSLFRHLVSSSGFRCCGLLFRIAILILIFTGQGCLSMTFRVAGLFVVGLTVFWHDTHLVKSIPTGTTFHAKRTVRTPPSSRRFIVIKR